MIKKKIKILLTCIGHVPKKIFLSELKKSFKYDYEIIGTDTNKKTKNSKYVDFFYKVPSGKNKNFNNAIYKICLKHKINIVLPAADEEVFSLIKYKKKFNKINCFLPLINIKQLKQISNKINLCKLANKLNIPFYGWHIAKNYEELIKILNSYIDKNIYCVIKPPLSRGGRDIYVLLNNDKKKFKPSRLCRELHMGYSYFFRNFKKNKLSFPTLVTDYLRPPVYDVDILSFKGILKKIVIRKRKISSDPNRGHVVVKNKKISAYCRLVVKKMRLSYLFDFDIMHDVFNHPKLVEINPRMSGSISESYKKKNYLVDNLIDLIHLK